MSNLGKTNMQISKSHIIKNDKKSHTESGSLLTSFPKLNKKIMKSLAVNNKKTYRYSQQFAEYESKQKTDGQIIQKDANLIFSPDKIKVKRNRHMSVKKRHKSKVGSLSNFKDTQNTSFSRASPHQRSFGSIHKFETQVVSAPSPKKPLETGKGQFNRSIMEMAKSMDADYEDEQEIDSSYTDFGDQQDNGKSSTQLSTMCKQQDLDMFHTVDAFKSPIEVDDDMPTKIRQPFDVKVADKL